MNSSGFMRKVIGTTVRYFSKKPKPKMKPIELKTPPEQTQTITRVIFDVVKEHGPLTIGDTWEHVKNVGVRGLSSKRHMKIILRWMRERQKLRMICNHIGPHKLFLYTTWFTNPKAMPLPKRASLNHGTSLPSIHPKAMPLPKRASLNHGTSLPSIHPKAMPLPKRPSLSRGTSLPSIHPK